MAYAFTFPGQGSQFVGMGKELADNFASARDVFGEVNEALQQNLSRLMFEGPEDELTLTHNAQPALMAVSLAVVHCLKDMFEVTVCNRAKFVAGHSLGEYSALAASDAFDIPTTARLLKQRGQAMQRAVPVGEGAMAALLGLDLETAQAVAAAAARGDVCTTANDNAPGQVVVSGHKAAVERALGIAKEHGAKRAVLLPVSAPFHCPLMQPAADEMAEALEGIRIQSPAVPLVANVTAAPEREPDRIRKLLVEQVTGLVRWRESVVAMADQNVHTLVELGAGKVLTGLVKRIDSRVTGISIQSPADMEAFAKSLAA